MLSIAAQLPDAVAAFSSQALDYEQRSVVHKLVHSRTPGVTAGYHGVKPVDYLRFLVANSYEQAPVEQVIVGEQTADQVYDATLQSDEPDTEGEDDDPAWTLTDRSGCGGRQPPQPDRFAEMEAPAALLDSSATPLGVDHYVVCLSGLRS
jgi:hypothetical protein